MTTGPVATDSVAVSSVAFVNEIAEKMTAAPTVILWPDRFLKSVRIDSNRLAGQIPVVACRTNQLPVFVDQSFVGRLL
jgi:hypothetical protein